MQAAALDAAADNEYFPVPQLRQTAELDAPVDPE
jgi:hypothetical protein